MSMKKFLDEMFPEINKPTYNKAKYLERMTKLIFDEKERLINGFIYLINETNKKETLKHVQGFKKVAIAAEKVPEYCDILKKVMISQSIKNKQEIRFELHEILEELENTLSNLTNKKNIGFHSGLDKEIIKSLYEKVKGTYFNSKQENFIAFLSGKPVTEKIIYTLEKSNGKPHLTALREFFTLLKIKPTQRILKELIADKQGKEIILPKPKKNEYSFYYLELEEIINSL